MIAPRSASVSRCCRRWLVGEVDAGGDVFVQLRVCEFRLLEEVDEVGVGTGSDGANGVLVEGREDGRAGDVCRIELETVQDRLTDEPPQRRKRQRRRFVGVIGKLAASDVAVTAREPDFLHVRVGVLVVPVWSRLLSDPRLRLIPRSFLVLQ